MTIPSNIILPLHSEMVKSGKPDDLDKYLRELIFSLQTMYDHEAIRDEKVLGNCLPSTFSSLIAS